MPETFFFEKQPSEVVTKGVDFAEIIPSGISISSGAVHITTFRQSVNPGAVVDKGNGKVGFPVTKHKFVSGDTVRLYGTVNYNSTYTVDSDTTENEVVVTASYVAETFVGTEIIGRDDTALFSAVAVVSGTAINFQVGAKGTPGQEYHISVFANLNNSDVLERDVIMKVYER